MREKVTMVITKGGTWKRNVGPDCFSVKFPVVSLHRNEEAVTPKVRHRLKLLMALTFPLFGLSYNATLSLMLCVQRTVFLSSLECLSHLPYPIFFSDYSDDTWHMEGLSCQSQNGLFVCDHFQHFQQMPNNFLRISDPNISFHSFPMTSYYLIS